VVDEVDVVSKEVEVVDDAAGCPPLRFPLVVEEVAVAGGAVVADVVGRLSSASQSPGG
jgi:hypothetical protein